MPPPPGIVSGRGCVTIVILSDADTVTPPLLTETGTGNVPAEVGVPVNAPEAESERPSTGPPDQV
jgi:hypothetical protein